MCMLHKYTRSWFVIEQQTQEQAAHRTSSAIGSDLTEMNETRTPPAHCALPWRVSAGLVDTAEVAVVPVLPAVDLDVGESPPSTELMSCSGRRVSVD